MPRAKNINERSTMKEDESALLVYLHTRLCLVGNLWDKTLCPDPATCTENCCLGKISDPSLSCLKYCVFIAEKKSIKRYVTEKDIISAPRW